MLTEDILDTLNGLGLHAMAEALRGQMASPRQIGLAFEDRLAALVEAERLARADGRVARFVRRSALPQGAAAVVDIDFRRPRGLRRDLIATLARGDWVRGHQNLLITGPPGIGKTFVACALGSETLRQGLSVGYWRTVELVERHIEAHEQRRLQSTLKKLNRARLLILDDFAVDDVTAVQTQWLRRLIAARDGRGATLIVSPVPLERWGERLPDPDSTDVIVDRFNGAHAHLIALTGASMRPGKTVRSSEPRKGASLPS